jgi:hypothetical protein
MDSVLDLKIADTARSDDVDFYDDLVAFMYLGGVDVADDFYLGADEPYEECSDSDCSDEEHRRGHQFEFAESDPQDEERGCDSERCPTPRCGH